ncbi:hypothetical protein BCR37DRAFT_143784 [Protomyces lactucae-debilis]|uniref:Uncharacterized protein n=1 Tax=Protomyces lactucae-debilis TaxID=2754530 RepID=A0A1Y2FUY6_PROLT|nr:uncharacterized protein BCR37DRAFT_143784 [Protomyces lactucae-debilis]ORY87104.1 hypothetical protein BCR37DRAFT_143784 [Protomyces lactucae-debilis]
MSFSTSTIMMNMIHQTVRWNMGTQLPRHIRLSSVCPDIRLRRSVHINFPREKARSDVSVGLSIKSCLDCVNSPGLGVHTDESECCELPSPSLKEPVGLLLAEDLRVNRFDMPVIARSCALQTKVFRGSLPQCRVLESRPRQSRGDAGDRSYRQRSQSGNSGTAPPDSQ